MNRRLVLTTGLVATLALTAWAAWQDDAAPADAVAGVAPARSRPAGGGVPTASAAPLAPTAASGVASAAPEAAASAARAPWPELADAARNAWGPPPPPPPPPAAPVVATAPAPPPVPKFPFRWIGRLIDGNTTFVLLASDERSFGARAGEVVASEWRIERITDQRLDVTWLPTGTAVAVPKR